MDWTSIAIGGAVGLVVGIWATNIYHKILVIMAMRSIQKKLGINAEELIRKAVDEAVPDPDLTTARAVRCEYAQEQLFAYDAATSAFMAQGRTLADLRERLHRDYGTDTEFVLEFDVSDEVKQRILKELQS